MEYIKLELTREGALQQLGIKKLYSHQQEPVQAILDGRDVLVTMPTGSGKSMIFQLPALLRQPALTLVVSPLKALQEDQVRGLRKKRVAARALNSALTVPERAEVFQKLLSAGLALLYIAPEQLKNQDLRDALATVPIAHVVVDEAHCAVDSFRKAYAKIGKFIASLDTRPVVVALTATATTYDRKAIIKGLKMEKPYICISPIRRENLHIHIKKVEPRGGEGKTDAAWRGKRRIAESALRDWDGEGSAILYCTTVRDAKKLYKWLGTNGWDVGLYHGKMTDKQRESAQRAFMTGKNRIMVATNAFGLGIDKPDVRLVIHAGLPLTVDGYVQEIGRAGRDGKEADCVLIYAPSDLSANKATLSHGTKKKHRNHLLKRLKGLECIVKSDQCLWRGVEKQFGEKPGKACGKCCNCLLKARKSMNKLRF